MADFLRLDGGGDTLLLSLEAGPPRLAYWGEALPASLDEAGVAALAERAVPNGMLDDGEQFDVFPEAARGFSGHPALEVHRPSGGFLTQLQFVEARAIEAGHEVRCAIRWPASR